MGTNIKHKYLLELILDIDIIHKIVDAKYIIPLTIIYPYLISVTMSFSIAKLILVGQQSCVNI